ncbi:hypothetical protein EV207_11068 [Scopulibacillus darangshiensis]|uniref:Uncharacterized protein n=1 Tax=Scopulibacillus darangshiensis TaxID=442528 RepID=A0A4R2P480_9BACL|nr:hypothetical protein [Scopulibacillus darangshiensis]TCP29447.1 hypothetical protein EV207_11068 [Scopulibacillus darangshiensis]
MKEKDFSIKMIGYIILAGAVLTLISTVLHPLTIDPWNGLRAIAEIQHDPAMWMSDHILMLVAVFLWLFGLSAGELRLTRPTAASRSAGRLFSVSVAIWVLVLCAELTALPLLAARADPFTENTVFLVWKALFSFGLLSGYIAVVLTWLGVSLLSSHLQNTGEGPKWMGLLGFYGGWLGVIGILFTLIFPSIGIFLLPITSAIPFLWTIFFGWRLIKN